MTGGEGGGPTPGTGDDPRNRDRRAGPRASPGPRRPAPPVRRRATFRRGDPTRRLRVALVCIGFVISLFAGRLVQLQGMEYGKYRAIAQRERLQTIQIPAVRGSIQGADGRPLAMTVQANLVYADPTQMKGTVSVSAEAEKAKYAGQLAAPLAMSAGDILTRLDHPTSPQYVVLKDAVTPQATEQISALRVPGIAMNPEFRRVYPNGSLAGSLLGFTTTDSSGILHGAAGLEYADNSLLTGRSGSQEVEIGADNQPIPTAPDRMVPAVPGRSVRLTILPDLQWEAEQACSARVRQVKADSCMAVVMQPQTGQVPIPWCPTYSSPAAPRRSSRRQQHLSAAARHWTAATRSRIRSPWTASSSTTPTCIRRST